MNFIHIGLLGFHQLLMATLCWLLGNMWSTTISGSQQPGPSLLRLEWLLCFSPTAVRSSTTTWSSSCSTASLSRLALTTTSPEFGALRTSPPSLTVGDGPALSWLCWGRAPHYSAAWPFCPGHHQLLPPGGPGWGWGCPQVLWCCTAAGRIQAGCCSCPRDRWQQSCLRRGWGSQVQTLALGSAGYLLVLENTMRFDLSSLGVDGKVPPGVSHHYQVPDLGILSPGLVWNRVTLSEET